MDEIIVTSVIHLNGNINKFLSDYTTEKTGFNWLHFAFKKTKLILKEINIYDKDDLKLLIWFLYNGFHVNMLESNINSEMLIKLADEIETIPIGYSLKLYLPWIFCDRDINYIKEKFNNKNIVY